MVIMFDHAVKYHGKYYPANTPIEEIAEPVEETTQGPETEPVEETVEDKPETAKKGGRSRKKGDA